LVRCLDLWCLLKTRCTDFMNDHVQQACIWSIICAVKLVFCYSLANVNSYLMFLLDRLNKGGGDLIGST
jgi:hypothetical protein